MVGVYESSGANWGRRKTQLTQLKCRRPVSINVISDGITRLPILEGEVSHIEVPRAPCTSLGITIVGGSDTPLRCVVIQEIFPDGLAAQDGRLQSGDQIIEIDGMDMTAATHSHVCQELRKNKQQTLRLGIYRERIQVYRTSPQINHQPLHNEDYTSVTLWQERCRPLGVKLRSHRNQSGIYVCEILPDSVASRDGRLHPHDRILAINDYDVRHTRLDAAMRLLDRSESSVIFSVAINNNNSDGTSVCSSVTNESMSDHCSYNSSPRIYLPFASSSSPHSSADSGIQSTSSSMTSHYIHSDVTDTDDSDSVRSETDRRVVSPIHTWPQGNANDRQLVTINQIEEKWTPPPLINPQITKKTTVIKKACTESLGMRIGGGVASNEGDTPIYIANINPNGPVGKSNNVKKGDVLLSVNGQSLLGLTHGQAVAQLKATAELAGVTLSLLDGPETSLTSSTANFVPSWLYWQKLPRPLQISRSVVLQRTPGSSLGFSIVGGADPSRGPEPIHVLLVVASSPAAIDGKLRCGDRILAVDNFSLENVSHSSAVGLLKQAGQRVHLEVVSWLGTEL